MDIKFYIPRGCYYLVQGGGTPYWRISGVSLPYPSWVSSVHVSTADNIATIPCFNGVKIAAIIGDGFGQATAQITALLGSNAAQNAAEGVLNASGNASRASSIFGPAAISSKGGAVYRVLLTSVGAAGMQDQERHILNFQIGGITV